MSQLEKIKHLWGRVSNGKKNAEKKVKDIYNHVPSLTALTNTVENTFDKTQAFKKKPKKTSEPKNMFSLPTFLTTSENEKKSESGNSNDTENMNLSDLDFSNNGDTLNSNAIELLYNYIRDKKLNDNKTKKIINNIIEKNYENIHLSKSLNHKKKNLQDDLKRLQNIIKTERYILDNMQENIKKIESKWIKSKKNKNKIKKTETIKKNIESKLKQISKTLNLNEKQSFKEMIPKYATENERKKRIQQLKKNRQNIVKDVTPINFSALKH